jgi:hypothetical protein
MARKPTYLGHPWMENDNALIADALVTNSDGRGERETAYKRWQDGQLTWSVGADNSQATCGFLLANNRRAT